MKRAAVALRTLLVSAAASVGLEGAFLLIGTVCLAYASLGISTYGPAAVVGAVALLVGIALTVPRRAD